MNNLLSSLYLIFLTFLFSPMHCKQDLPPCNGDCTGYKISGRFYDITTNMPLANQYVKVDSRQNQYCVICPEENTIASGNTDSSGRFICNVNFDTSWFNNYYLMVMPTLPNNYLLYVNNDQDRKGTYPFYIDNFDSTNYNNIQFGFYPKANLTINLHRTTNIYSNDASMFLDFRFQDQNSANYFIDFDQSNINKDTTILVSTAANIFTYIESEKSISADSVIRKTDSIRCFQNMTNKIDIYY